MSANFIDQISMQRIRQSFPRPRIENLEEQIESEMESYLSQQSISPGQTVAIAVGSRGIANLREIVASTVKSIKKASLLPFIVPSMGSHGGATAEGQTEVLAALGIQEETVGCEIRSSMETVSLGTTASGIPIYVDRIAKEADHLFLINRVKCHTMFSGEVQSGLQKMLIVGLGNHRGAEQIHIAAKAINFDQLVREARGLYASQLSILGGLMVVENAFKEIAQTKVSPFESFPSIEQELLNLSNSLMGKIPLDRVDLLIVDRLGKNISGTGLDNNVVGRKFQDQVSTKHDWIQTKLIIVKGLTEETQGNANGIGMAAFTTQQVVDQINWKKTYKNALTSQHPTGSLCPIICATDRDAIEAGLSCLRHLPEPRVVQISQTGRLEEMLVSQCCLRELQKNSQVELVGEPDLFSFGEDGQLRDVF